MSNKNKETGFLKLVGFISKYKFHILIFIFSFLVLSSYQIDPDLGWHIALGSKFLESGQIINSDTFSWTLAGHSWHLSYLLYQIIVAFLFEKLPFVLIGMLFGILASISLVILVGRKINFVGFLACMGAISILVINLGIRPHTFSIFIFAIELLLLDKKLYLKPIHVVFWFLIFALWVNLHQGFLIGLGFFGFYLVLDLVWTRAKGEKRSIFPVLLCFLASIVATFLNPFGIGMWMTMFSDSGFLTTWLNISEFQSTAVFFPTNLFLGLSGFVFMYIFMRKKIEAPLFVGAAMLFAASFMAVLMAFFWVAIFIFVVSRYLDFEIKVKIDKASKAMMNSCFFVLFVTLMLNFVLQIIISSNLDSRIVHDGYPLGAARFVEQNGYSQNVFNDYGWGGFIDWRNPNIHVFIDGRMASWKGNDGVGILSDYISILKADCDVLAKYDIHTVLVKKQSSVGCFSDFEKVYEDDASVVLIKK